MASKNLEKLFIKEMNRRQFLAHIGAGFLAVIGVSGLIKHLLHYDGRQRHHEPDSYGSSSYSGTKR